MSPSHVIYADIECILKKGKEEEENVLHRHEPIAAAFLVVPHHELRDRKEATYHYFQGRDCIPQLLQSLEEEVNEIARWNEINARQPMQPLTPLQKLEYNASQRCRLCKEEYDATEKRKVHDHCHLTGKYRGPTCQACNTKMRLKRTTVPVLFHNWKG